MNRFRKLIAIAVLVAIVVMAVTPAAAKVTVVFLADGDPSQWGVKTALVNKVNEYEGQHRVVGAFGQHGGRFSPLRKVNEYEGQH